METLPFIRRRSSGKPVVLVFGSGPIRIGQGIEFDYASVHCVMALKRAGYEVAIANNNPETVSPISTPPTVSTLTRLPRRTHCALWNWKSP